MRSTSRRASLLAIAALVSLVPSPASADGGHLHEGRDPSRLDIVRIAHRHVGDAFVTHRVVFRERVSKPLLVGSFELYLEGRRGTTSPFTSPSTLVYGATRRVGDRILMRLSSFDVEMVPQRIVDVPIRVRARSVRVRIPVAAVSTTTPFTYRWVARTTWSEPGEPIVDDQSDWLWHRIRA
jgi:hypothetical protein